jgi:hypothetical protein
MSDLMMWTVSAVLVAVATVITAFGCYWWAEADRDERRILYGKGRRQRSGV